MAENTNTSLKVSIQPLHDGRISPMLYGGFIELLDDLVPGMWAELLNDRCFEGIAKASKWCYYLGEPNFCDRTWDSNSSWVLDTTKPFIGTKSAKLTAGSGRKGSLTQSGLTVKKWAIYVFSGYIRTDSDDVRIRVQLKTQLPDDTWMVLGYEDIPNPGREWTKCTCKMICTGGTDKTVFELEVTGNGSAWVDKLSLMPSDNVKGWRKDVLEVVKDTNHTIMRWGGSLIDPGGYKWKECIGDRDLRLPFPNEYWGRIDPNDVGIDEFLQFCELAEVEPLLCVAFGDGVQSTKDLVEYCNGSVNSTWGKTRAENGHPEPYNVKYWQVGNEVKSDDYDAQCLAFCKAIKEVDPNSIILSSYPTPELIGSIGDYISYTCPHHYTPELEKCQESIDKAKTILSETGHSDIKLGITEWNTTAGDWGLGRGNLLTLQCALFAGKYLNLLHRNSDVVEIACRSNLVNSYNSGQIQTNLGSVLRTPGCYVMKLYADHSKPIPLRIKNVPEGLDVSACSSEDRAAICLFAINQTAEPIELALDLSEFGSNAQPIGGEIVCDTLDMRQPDLTNVWANPDRVKITDFLVTGKSTIIPAYSAAAIECVSSQRKL